MSFEEEFDDIVRQKGEELNFPMDERNWEKASAMLDAESTTAFDNLLRQKSGELDYPFSKKDWRKMATLLDAEQGIVSSGFKKYALAALLAGIALLSGLAVFMYTRSAEPSQHAIADNTSAHTNAVQHNGHTGAQQPTDNNNTTVASQQNNHTDAEHSAAQPQATTHEPSGTSVQPAQQSVASHAPVKEQVLSESAMLVTKARTNKITPSVAAQPKTVMPPVLASSRGNDPEETASPENTSPDANSRKALNSKADHGNDPAKTNSDNALDPTAFKAAGTMPPVAVPGMQSNDASGKAEKPTVADSQQSGGQQEIITEPVAQMPLLPVQQAPLAEPEIANAPLYQISRNDEDYFKLHKTHFMELEAGATYLLGWHTAAGLDGKGLDWFGGVNYGRYIGRKFSVSVGLQGYSIRNITQANYSTSSTQYGFGSVSSNTVITSNNLIYAAVPLRAAYIINKTSSFALGANLGYLLSSNNRIDTYEIQDNVKTHEHSEKNSGVYQNANSVNLMLTASYKVEIVPRLYINTELVYGLTDIFKNTHNNTNKEIPVGVRFGLQYALFDR